MPDNYTERDAAQMVDDIARELRRQQRPLVTVDQQRIEAASQRLDNRFAGEGKVKVLMQDGKWLVPDGQRPAMGAVPVEGKRK